MRGAVPEMEPLLAHGVGDRVLVGSRLILQPLAGGPGVELIGEIPNLALFKQEKGPLRPFTVGKIFSFGTLTLSKTISPVIEALSESLPLILLA